MQLFPFVYSFDLPFSDESLISCSGHLLHFIFTNRLCSFPLSLTSQSKFLWSSVAGAHLCTVSLSAMTLTALLSDLPSAWCLLHSFLTFLFSLTLQFPLSSSLQLVWIVFPHWASTPSLLFLSSSSSFTSSPCYFHFQFSRDSICNPFWQWSGATFLSISLVNKGTLLTDSVSRDLHWQETFIFISILIIFSLNCCLKSIKR